MTDVRTDHWENVYTTKADDSVSWFEQSPAFSLELIAATGIKSASVIDIGGGASRLVDTLVAEGHNHVAVLDLSAHALDIAKSRMGHNAGTVEWIVGNVTTWKPAHQYDIWHDRAVFHFLTDQADRTAYVRQVMKSVKPGGHVIVATFAPDGPDQCSGLPVARYDPEQLHGEFGPSFELLEHATEEHKTPWGSVQHFVYCHCLTPH